MEVLQAQGEEDLKAKGLQILLYLQKPKKNIQLVVVYDKKCQITFILLSVALYAACFP